MVSKGEKVRNGRKKEIVSTIAVRDVIAYTQHIRHISVSMQSRIIDVIKATNQVKQANDTLR